MNSSNYPCAVVTAEKEIKAHCYLTYNSDEKTSLQSLVVKYDTQCIELIQSSFPLKVRADKCIVEVDSGSSLFDSFHVRFLPQYFQLFYRYIPVHRDFDAVSAENFYSKKEDLNPQQEETQIFETFSRQELAFQKFDSLSESDRTKCKVFTFESIQSGQRRFLVGGMDRFYQMYFEIPIQNRHVYEIIRESFPCRLYFDLEYPISFNPNTNGNELTKKFIHLVLWKLYEHYQLLLSWENVLVLDSTTKDKFSKHVIIHLKEANDSLEYLFIDNTKIIPLLEEIVHDMTTTATTEMTTKGAITIEDTENDKIGNSDRMDIDNDSPSDERIYPADGELLPIRVVRKPKAEFEEFWLLNDKKERQFFVDLGVYSRNRAFRLFGSCKYGKTKSLILTPADKSFYFSSQTSNENSKLDTQKLREQRTLLLNDSFVVPFDILLFYDSDDDENEEVSSEEEKSEVNAMPNNETEDMVLDENGVVLQNDDDVSNDKERNSMKHQKNSIKLKKFSEFEHQFNTQKYRIIPSQIQKPACSFNSCSSLQSFSISPPTGIHSFQNYFGSSFSSSSNWKASAMLKSSFPRQESPFPLLDKYLSSTVACKGGIQGILNDWQIYKTRNGDFPIYKIRYQILKNRYCENIGRSHKSNGVYYEINLMNHEFVQCCWDADCRGFKSSPVVLPESVFPRVEMISKIIDKIGE
jgi:hypothetical protein